MLLWVGSAMPYCHSSSIALRNFEVGSIPQKQQLIILHSKKNVRPQNHLKCLAKLIFSNLIFEKTHDQNFGRFFFNLLFHIANGESYR